MVFKIGWFSTGRDKAARDLLRTIYNSMKLGKMKATLSFVFCNRALGESEESDRFLKMVEDYGIDLICYSSKNFKPDMRRAGITDPVVLEKWRRKYDNKIIKRLTNYTTDLNVLAGYMLVVSSKMCEELDMINLHPAAPGGPSGTWQEVIWKLIDLKADATGVMIHLVTSKLDEGPPVTYCTFPVKGPVFDKIWNNLNKRLKTKSLTQIMREDGESNELFMEIRRQGFIREQPLLIKTVEAFAEGRIRLENKRLFMGNETIKDGLCLNKEIEAYL
ncbi:MAG: formyltransferase family protein [Thermodesulfobacteriota bacterium]